MAAWAMLGEKKSDNTQSSSWSGRTPDTGYSNYWVPSGCAINGNGVVHFNKASDGLGGSGYRLLCLSYYMLLTEWTIPGKYNQFNSIGRRSLNEATDLTALVSSTDANKLRDDVRLSLTVELTRADRYPTVFELTRKNNHDGIIVALPAPAGGWKVGVQKIVATIPESAYRLPQAGGDIGWSDMNRLELYANEASDEKSCYLAYCNAYGDLRNAFCGGDTCDSDSEYTSCKSHWSTNGKSEPYRSQSNPEVCGQAYSITLRNVALRI